LEQIANGLAPDPKEERLDTAVRNDLEQPRRDQFGDHCHGCDHDDRENEVHTGAIMPNLKARVVTLEGPFGRSPLTVIISAVGDAGNENLAGYRVGGLLIERREGESIESLQERAEAAATPTGGVRVLKEVLVA
jgi:hypothetical protein